ncbi:serine hydrolase domain-containing protein [Hirschia maritima]|uniref:serine hydrolase domain-containing protein n=1 Tax=Hirschia maritima TaxID=1121961 RepID=UPI00036C6D61|nr:serine hydrolase domain-containing protein [Hirschia maritima]
MRLIYVFLLLFIGLTACSSVKSTELPLQTRLEAVQSQFSDVPGFALYILHKEEERAETGLAAADGPSMTVATPVRIASITKTYVAAAILRLWEDGLIELDAPIGDLISAESNALLKSDGYDTDQITVRHLLLHSSGMPDHVNDAYVELVFSKPNKIWAPTNQIEFLVNSTDPLETSGKEFSYSDTGYILLGEILRETTGVPLHQAVRDLLKLDELQLSSTYWDEAEQPIQNAPERAHQWFLKQDTYEFHGSLDAYGGGGVVASVRDIAIFYHALFNGSVFHEPSTLQQMTTGPEHPHKSPYRYGLFEEEILGHQIFYHSGFWGTNVIHVPTLNLTIAGVTLDERGFDPLKKMMNKVIADRLE